MRRRERGRRTVTAAHKLNDTTEILVIPKICFKITFKDNSQC